MIKIYSRIPIAEFEAWGEKSQKTLEKIILDNKSEEFETMINTFYPNGIEDVELNDLLAFRSTLLLKILQIKE